MKFWGKQQGAAGDLDFARLAPPYRRFIDEQLAIYGLDRHAFCRPIAAADEMFFKAILPNYEHDAGIAAFKYVESTLRYLDAYEQVVRQVFGGYERLESVLDFASGYGRLTRALTQKLPKERIWVADIYAEAVAWQAKAFGVHAFPSAPAPDAVRHERTHDIVWVGSMFSHLPAPLFHQWLAKLYSFVSPRGVLAFSVHDETLLPPGEAMDDTGLRYFRFSESGSLDHDIYGMSYVTEAFVGEAIARLAPGGGPKWKRFFKGLYENQDLYVVAGPEADLSNLRVASTPMGGFEQAAHLTNGDVEFSGWTIERTPGERIEQVRVHVDGVAVGSAEPGGARLDVLEHFPHAANAPTGFSFRLAQARPGAAVRLQLESSSGLRGHVFAEVPQPVALTYSGWSRRALKGTPTGLR